MARRRPLVAIIGRPNVGKSTLFNRLLQSRWAITDGRPGVTRDRIYAETEWEGQRFTLVDTGGFIPRAKDALEAAVRSQASMAVAEADVVILVCDASTGLTDLDREVAAVLRRQQLPCMLVVNKVDHPEKSLDLGDFYRLGLGEPLAVSAATGRRSGDLLETLVQLFGNGEFQEQTAGETAIKVALVGRPNVGKSTLINCLAGDQVSIVHEEPGTTRDTTNIRLAWKGREFLLMDTAGLRRRARVEDQVEFYSGRRALSSIENADVVVVLLDAAEGWALQDARIIGQVIETGCGLVLAVNKWDLIDTEVETSREFVADLHERFPFLVDYPVLLISARTGRRVHKCLETVVQVSTRRQTRIPTARLNHFIEELSSRHPPVGGGREIRLLYATQHGVNPPTFVVFSNHPELLSRGYRRFLEKKLREEFDFEGTPLRIVWRQRRGS